MSPLIPRTSLFILNLIRRNERRVAFVGATDDCSTPRTYSPVDICDSLMTLSHPPKDCLSFVLRKNSLYREIDAIKRETMVKVEQDGVSLDRLLERTLHGSPSPRLIKDECLPLAIIIASSLLQLHATPWLPEKWCAKSIYFADHVNQQRTRFPYIASQLGEASRPGQILAKRGFHPDLVTLGIILLELSEKKSISQWYSETFGGSLPPDIRGKAEAAWDWFEDDASERMSPHYAVAFKHCFNVHFLGSFPPHRMTLADDSFREAVYSQIVRRLERAWSEYITPITAPTLQSI